MQQVQWHSRPHAVMDSVFKAYLEVSSIDNQSEENIDYFVHITLVYQGFAATRDYEYAVFRQKQEKSERSEPLALMRCACTLFSFQMLKICKKFYNGLNICNIQFFLDPMPPLDLGFC